MRSPAVPTGMLGSASCGRNVVGVRALWSAECSGIKSACQSIVLSAILITIDGRNNIIDVFHMISSAQIRAARALLAIDQRKLAELSDLSVPTIQRMEASEEVVRGNVDSLMKLIAALDAAGIELIGPGAASAGGGGRGVRFKG
ncbi:MAG TPA: helix-turn-helix transcriptional regulator [Dongiaceae bacterium]|nr:helix-turn-helix transcriptional regulator [Dongiaceae bacterium]